jgi:hypothetical protein
MSMKLDLKVLKNVLIMEDGGGCDDIEKEINEWVKNNIGEEEVSIEEWIDVFGKYWNEWSDDYGDSVMMESVLKEDYKLSDEDIRKVMDVYWSK